MKFELRKSDGYEMNGKIVQLIIVRFVKKNALLD